MQFAIKRKFWDFPVADGSKWLVHRRLLSSLNINEGTAGASGDGKETPSTIASDPKTETTRDELSLLSLL